ncbi:hypothetical protein QE197_25990 (plasmid) [Arsenophonus nasoniae]|uniref:Uncharacterized protein n=1 Tax=Arsenophonus nasoniae TaxID=638 RepID=A0A4P7L351_9GAMM|nr:hypothetical protein [Arsenophonus nasoniae]QBY47031.1 hypothetical protein ArsFIN_56420 [Arsenophonus nasoniae]WGM09220.1 hypothetical protein QE258_28210 [Arsenophonus nasoniae]WGM13943.1 hypothetical protein QE197_25990 [Arsenophonus nasoniae]WGM18565.1 hypothetical protein QE193_25705 [Arsenophonus nasoniae]
MATANISTSGLFDTLESALMKIEYADSIAVMLLNQSNLKKHDEIILSALLDLINEVRGNLMKVFYERDCRDLADGEYRN